jgi:hypothetical protein
MFDLIRPLICQELGGAEAMWTHDAKWTSLAMEDGRLGSARHHARYCVMALPFRPYSWRLSLWSHLGRMGRALNPHRRSKSSD